MKEKTVQILSANFKVVFSWSLNYYTAPSSGYSGLPILISLFSDFPFYLLTLKFCFVSRSSTAVNLAIIFFDIAQVLRSHHFHFLLF